MEDVKIINDKNCNKAKTESFDRLCNIQNLIKKESMLKNLCKI